LSKKILDEKGDWIVGYEQNILAKANKVMQFPLRPGVPADANLIAQLVEGVIIARSRRSFYFQATLFADPAWDILLVLTLSEARHHRLTVSKLCDRVEAPATTALRWITTLTDAGLLVRRNDPTDKRRKYIELSSDAYAKMVEYCSSFNAATLLAA
jgi:hypothetical protein